MDISMIVAVVALVVALYSASQSRRSGGGSAGYTKREVDSKLQASAVKITELENRFKLVADELEHRKNDVERLEQRQYDLMTRVATLEAAE
jgi:hypothetical protein